MPYVEKRIISGSYLEIIRYMASCEQMKSRLRPRQPKEHLTTEKQIRQNIKNSIHSVKRLMHCNFRHYIDLFVTLTFEDKDNITEKIAMKELANFFRRVKYYREKNDMPPLKYIWCMGKDKKDGLHFHLLMNEINFEDLKNIWKKSELAGRIQMANLEYDNDTGLYEIARYFIKDNALRVLELKLKDVNNVIDFSKKLNKKWATSQNLKKPIVSKPKIIKSLALREIPKEYKLYRTLKFETIPTDYGLYQHIELLILSKMRN